MSAVVTQPGQTERAKAERLAHAAEVGDSAMLENLLASGVNVDSATENGMTALMRAASNGHVHIVRLLLDHGALANAKRSDGLTALSLAAFLGHLEVVELLLRKGVDAEARTSAEMLAKGRGFLRIVELLEQLRPEGQVPLSPVGSQSRIAPENKIPEEQEKLPGDLEITINANPSALDKTPQASAILQVLPLLAGSRSNLTRVGAITFFVIVICGLAASSVVRMARQGPGIDKTIIRSDDSTNATQSAIDSRYQDSSRRPISEQTEPGAVFDAKSSEGQRASVEEVLESPRNLEKLGRPQSSVSERTMPLPIAVDGLAKMRQIRDSASGSYRTTGRSPKKGSTLYMPPKIEGSRSGIILSEGDALQKTEPEVDTTPAPLTIEPSRRPPAKASPSTNVDETRSDRSTDLPAPSSNPKKKVIQWP